MPMLIVTKNGEEYSYPYYDDSTFLVQVGKNPKASYSTVLSRPATPRCLGQLWMHYAGITVHSGTKKRFVIVPKSGERVVVIRKQSV